MATKEKMKVRVVSDGTPFGTQVLDENGESLTDKYCITALSWSLSMEGEAILTVKIRADAVDLKGVWSNEHV